MASSLAWLDFSEAEQRRAREIVQLFTQRESRDELGIGVVRDAFSNLLFPGVSVIHTRARYFCLIPWMFTKAAERGRSGPKLLVWQERNERRLVETLRAGGDEEGLIGRQAGKAVKTLPSVIYWSSLQRYGILRVPATIEQVAAGAKRGVSIEDAITEQVDRSMGYWHPYLPEPPAGFPDVDQLDFELTDEESAWLRERVTGATEGSLLAWMITNRVTPTDDSAGPWDQPWSRDLPGEITRAIGHAERFSVVMHGAAILYNALLAERCDALGIGEWGADAATYREWFDDWNAEITARRGELLRWDLADFWQLVAEQSPGRTAFARRFIDGWIALALSGQARSKQADALVASREREQKRAQARLDNERLLRQWGGSSGTERLAFRWGQVRRMTTDLNGGPV